MLSMLRGQSRLCMDLLEHPDAVRSALRELLEAYKWISARRFEIVHAEEEGTSSMQMWAPGRFIRLGTDFGALISPRHYREFVVPGLSALCDSQDYSFFHLDGPEASHQIPALLDIASLNVIQFTIGAANAHLPATRWLPMYKRIQDAGKLLQISVPYAEVEALLEGLDPRGVFLVTSAPSVEAADALLRSAERWSTAGVHAVPRESRGSV